MPSTKFVFFGPIGKTRWQPWPLIGWYIFDFSSEKAEWHSTKLDMKQDLNALYQVCVFSSRSEKQVGRPGLWLAETFLTSPLKRLNGIQRNLTGSKISASSTKFVYFRSIRKARLPPWALIGCDIFRLFLWNPWTEFNTTWQEARSQHFLSGLRFLGRSEKQDSHPGLLFAETFSTSLKPLNGIQRNLTESKFSTSSTKFVFFGFMEKTIWPLWPLIDWDIFWLFLWNRWTEFSKTWHEVRPQRPLLSLCFSGGKVNKKGHPGQSVKEGGTLYSCARYVALWASYSPFPSQIFYAFIVLRWATMALWASCCTKLLSRSEDDKQDILAHLPRRKKWGRKWVPQSFSPRVGDVKCMNMYLCISELDRTPPERSRK